MSKVFETYMSNQALLERILRRYVKNSSDVEELKQEVFLRAYDYELKDEIRDPIRFLARTAKNLALKKVNRKENFVTRSEQEIDGFTVIKDDESVSQEDALDARQRFGVLVEAIAAMPDELSEALIMRRLEGQSVAEIAERLGLSESGIERRLARALVYCNDYIRSKGLDPADFGGVEKKKAKVEIMSAVQTARV